MSKEGEGFEPSRVLPPNDLANRPLHRLSNLPKIIALPSKLEPAGLEPATLKGLTPMLWSVIFSHRRVPFA